jgi:hypothetical protein
LAFARQRDAFGDLPAAFGRRRQDEIGRGHRRDFDVQIDAVDQRTRNARLIIGGAARIEAAAAGAASLSA